MLHFGVLYEVKETFYVETTSVRLSVTHSRLKDFHEVRYNSSVQKAVE
jgi:hypothetical protein